MALTPDEVLEGGIDWDSMENEYRAGFTTLRALGLKYHCGEAAIRGHARRYSWTRDLAAPVRARAEHLVLAAELRACATAAVRKQARIQVRSIVEAQTAADMEADIVGERDFIERAAAAVATVLLTHKSLLSRHLELASKLLEELEVATVNAEDFEKLGEMMYAPDEKGVDKLNALYKKVIDLPGRIDGSKKLGDNLKSIIQLQRQAIGIADNSNGEADTPDAPAMDDKEVARRLAFILNKGVNAL